MFARETVEDHDLIDAVEKLRPELLAQRIEHFLLHHLIRLGIAAAAIGKNQLAADVGGHDHHGVFEIHRAPVAIGEPPVVENLQ